MKTELKKTRKQEWYQKYDLGNRQINVTIIKIKRAEEQFVRMFPRMRTGFGVWTETLKC